MYVAVFINFLSIYFLFCIKFFIVYITVDLLNLTLRWFTYPTVRRLIASLKLILFRLFLLLSMLNRLTWCKLSRCGSWYGSPMMMMKIIVIDTKKPLCRVNDFNSESGADWQWNVLYFTYIFVINMNKQQKIISRTFCFTILCYFSSFINVFQLPRRSNQSTLLERSFELIS